MLRVALRRFHCTDRVIWILFVSLVKRFLRIYFVLFVLSATFSHTSQCGTKPYNTMARCYLLLFFGINPKFYTFPSLYVGNPFRLFISYNLRCTQISISQHLGHEGCCTPYNIFSISHVSIFVSSYNIIYSIQHVFVSVATLDSYGISIEKENILYRQKSTGDTYPSDRQLFLCIFRISLRPRVTYAFFFFVLDDVDM